MPAGMPYMAATNQRKDVLRLFSFPNSFYTILRVFRLWIFFYIFCVCVCVFSKYILKELVFDINPKVPAILIGDAEKIAHVLKILVENSIKFTEEGGVNVRIGYRQEGYGVNLIIDIHDTGIGMTNAQLTKMYDDFYQADSGSNRLAGGLGLGLPIARGLLNAMGGFIHFSSKTQQGLHAHIVIPQGVVDWRPCIMVAHADELCIGCFFKPDKYSFEEVRGYYDGLILSLMRGLGIKGTRPTISRACSSYRTAMC